MIFLFALFSFLTLASSQESTETSKRDRDGEAYAAAAASVKSDLEASLVELKEARLRIAEEKPSLARETNEITAALRKARREADLAKTERDAAADEFAKAEEELKAWRDERLYLESLFGDFAKTSIVTASPAYFDADIRVPSPSETDASLALIEASIDRLESVGMVSELEGRAITGDGVFSPGRFAVFGPLTWFVSESESESESGVVISGDDLRPSLVPLSNARNEIVKLLEGSSASPPFDPSGGNAIAMEETETGIIDHVRMGGFWIYPILFLALVALVSAIAKWIQLLRIGDFSASDLQRILMLASKKETSEALSETAGVRHPAARVLHEGIIMKGADN
ncbi:MAG: hypothetical protein AAGC68_04430, partial [Verrucomicrobiota bacterium]